MWLSKQTVNRNNENAAEIGTVTIEGNTLGVYMGSEHRDVSIASPGGYFWRPKVGANVLVIKTGDNERCAAGVLQNESVDLQTGEVYIKSENGGSIYLQNDGTITLKGKICIEGDLLINGNEIN